MPTAGSTALKAYAAPQLTPRPAPLPYVWPGPAPSGQSRSGAAQPAWHCPSSAHGPSHAATTSAIHAASRSTRASWLGPAQSAAPGVHVQGRQAPRLQLSRAAQGSGDYGPALWAPAASTNYTVGREGARPQFVVIHTMQGSYGGSISWFQNPSANVSA